MAEYYPRKEQCPRCARNGKDRHKDNFTNYGPGKGGYCHSCTYTILSDDEREARGLDEDEEEEEEVVTRDAITPEQNERIKAYSGIDPKGYRGLDKGITNKYKTRFQYDDETGEVEKVFHPTTIESKFVGYKTRVVPKDFTNPVGKVGRECDLMGQFLFEKGGRDVIITGGEIDALSVYQVLDEYTKSRGGSYDAPAVVSPTVGETGAIKQIQAQYDFFNKFENIFIGFDNDEAGRKATDKIQAVLPKGKVKVITWSKKDPNEMLQAGLDKKIINDFYNAKPYVPAGVLGSGELSDKIRDEVEIERIMFPPFMAKVNEMTGGIGLGRIVNLLAASGIGKTVYVDSSVYYWIYNSPHRVGVVSMELSASQYGLSMLSRHLGRKISSIENKDERIAFLNSPEVKEKEKDLLFRPDGSHRFHLVDDRDGSVEELQKTVEQLDCKIIILDPLQDILDGLGNEEQAIFMKWQKGLIKSHNVTFININHIRKSGEGKTQNSEGAMISEESASGSSTIFKSAAVNILLVRDKMNEDPIIRNTTKIFISKNRDNGTTGPAGACYYDSEKHQLVDLDEWQKENGVQSFLPDGS